AASGLGAAVGPTDDGAPSRAGSGVAAARGWHGATGPVSAAIHGAGAAASHARNWKLPRSAAALPSQCCSKLTANVRKAPLASNVASSTVKEPALFVHSRGQPMMWICGPVLLPG